MVLSPEVDYFLPEYIAVIEYNNNVYAVKIKYTVIIAEN